MKINIIAAMDRNGLIGNGPGLPWEKIRADMARFVQYTQNGIVIVGRKTFEGFGGPPKNRFHIILTRNIADKRLDPAQGVFVSSVQGALAHAMGHTQEHATNGKEVWVIGGSEIYDRFLPYAHSLVLTKIDAKCRGDAYFPEIDRNEWRLVWNEEVRAGTSDARGILTPYNLTFITYERKQ